jgi:hypothetical protein
MRYKVQTLYVDSEGIVDIPTGLIPIKYEETLETTSEIGTWGGIRHIKREIIALEPLDEDENRK